MPHPLKTTVHTIAIRHNGQTYRIPGHSTIEEFGVKHDQPIDYEVLLRHLVDIGKKD